MDLGLRRFWDCEIQPAVDGFDPAAGFVLVVGAAALLNKRYLGDPTFGGDGEQRWQALGAWLLACLALLGLARLRSRPAALCLGWLAGAALLAAAMSPTGFALKNGIHWRNPVAVSPFLMLLLAWIVVVPATVKAESTAPRTVAAVLLLLAGLAVVTLVLTGRGPARLMLLDFRYDKLNWCLLTCGWLFLGPVSLTWARLGGGLRGDGFGRGRVRLWLPLTAVFLALMVTLVVCYAGKQAAFQMYYPMFRRDWPNYDPLTDGYLFLVVYELAYGLYFLAWEFFFRGWLLFRLEPALGALAILVQMVPFAVMHIGKPGVELHSSLVAGVVLGWLAWRSRSFWPCFLLHWSVACTMDLVVFFHGWQAAAPR